MHRIRTFAACVAATVSLVVASSALAPAAMAGSTAPTATGSFHTWRAAQRAAGFGLLRPTRGHGLRQSDIIVDRCQVTGQLSKRNVIASYGSVLRRLLSIQQNNSGGPCGNFGSARLLGHYRVRGARASLFGVCGPHIGPSCRSRKIFLYLTWTGHRIYYQASSYNEPRPVVVGFARSLRRVG